MCHVLHYSCNVNAAVADSLSCRMICVTVPSSVHAWMPPATAATRSLVAAHSKPLPRQRGRHDRQWSCATTVEHAATVTMQIADAYVTQCRRPAVAHCRDNVVLCRSYDGKLERRDGSWSALGRAASGAHEEEETVGRITTFAYNENEKCPVILIKEELQEYHPFNREEELTSPGN